MAPTTGTVLAFIAAVIGLDAVTAISTTALSSNSSGGFPQLALGRRLHDTCLLNNCNLINGCSANAPCCCLNGGRTWTTARGCNFCCDAGKVGCADTTSDHLCYANACPPSCPGTPDVWSQNDKCASAYFASCKNRGRSNCVLSGDSETVVKLACAAGAALPEYPQLAASCAVGNFANAQEYCNAKCINPCDSIQSAACLVPGVFSICPQTCGSAGVVLVDGVAKVASTAANIATGNQPDAKPQNCFGLCGG